MKNLLLNYKKSKHLLSTGLLVCLLVLLPVRVVADDLTEEQRKGVLYPLYSDEECSGPTCACTASGSINLPGNDNLEKVWNFFISKGLAPHQAAGFMGNMQAEAHFEPRLVEYGWNNSRGEKSVAGQPSSLDENVPPDQSSKGEPGYGIIQWTSPSRKQGLRDKATSTGIKAGGLGLQLEYMWEELNGSYKASTLDPVRAATTYQEATNIVMNNYEIPGNKAKQGPIRLGFANDILIQFEKKASPTQTSPSISGGCAIAVGQCPTDPVTADQIIDFRGIKVHPCIQEELDRVLELAQAKGLKLSGGGYRSYDDQVRARKNNGCPDIMNSSPNACRVPTAKPGQSNHERGSAVDFTCDGAIISARSHECFVFLRENTTLINLESEPWHWSDDGK